MHKLMHRMERKQVIAHLLLTCLLAASAQYRNFSTIMVQAKESDNLELRNKLLESQSVGTQVLASWEKTRQEVEAKKIRKVPSGPNPIGNHHPPARP
ncbi:hypothetical protein MRB53_029307 [Persea americana]|uniref:Uncharacterized protein n=1 Tax=Persea americana TaxID=3435 RepID=A0ACC2KID8_PERAE|nr:hypothetical protein MRB53_029307 [Persea americana]